MLEHAEEVTPGYTTVSPSPDEETGEIASLMMEIADNLESLVFTKVTDIYESVLDDITRKIVAGVAFLLGIFFSSYFLMSGVPVLLHQWGYTHVDWVVPVMTFVLGIVGLGVGLRLAKST